MGEGVEYLGFASPWGPYSNSPPPITYPPDVVKYAV